MWPILTWPHLLRSRGCQGQLFEILILGEVVWRFQGSWFNPILLPNPGFDLGLVQQTAQMKDAHFVRKYAGLLEYFPIPNFFDLILAIESCFKLKSVYAFSFSAMSKRSKSQTTASQPILSLTVWIWTGKNALAWAERHLPYETVHLICAKK